jgi:predicted nuclease of predicted toxin-antitoxin system
MKLLLDQGLPRSAVNLLCEAGHDAIHTGDSGLATAADAVILNAARREGRTVVTLDADFHALLALAGAAEPSVIRIRIEGLRARPLADILLTVLDRCAEDLRKGAVVSVTEERIRLRRLPIRGGGSA